MTFEQLLARCKCGVHLKVNQHRDYYQTVAQYLAERLENSWAECIPDRADECDGETLVELRFYPDTPIGSYHIIGSTIESVMAVVEKCLEEKP